MGCLRGCEFFCDALSEFHIRRLSARWSARCAPTLGEVGRHLDQQTRAEILGISEVSIEAEAESRTTGSGGHRYHETAAIL